MELPRETEQGEKAAEAGDLAEQELERESLEAEEPSEELLYDLAELFRMFADSTRVRILHALMRTESGVTELAEGLNMTTSAVSHQLRILKDSKLVRARREGKTVIYSLADDHVRIILGMGMEHLME